MFELIWGRGGNTQRSANESTKYLFNCLKVLGANPTHKWRRLSYLYSAFIYISVVFYMPFAFILNYFFTAGQMPAGQLIFSLQYFLNISAVPVKLITLKLNMKRLRNAEIIMNTLDARCQLKKELQKIRECVQFGNRITLIYVFVYGICAGSSLLSAVIMGKPPYAIYIPLIDWTNSRWEFSIQASTECVLMMYISLQASLTDVYGVIYIYIIRTQVQILVDRVRRLATDKTESKVKNYQELVKCVKDHQTIFSLLDTISPIISVTIFVQFTVTAAILCATMINILLFADTSTQIASYIYILGVLVQISPCCYQATCLVEDNEQLPMAILHCNWIEEDTRFRKMLIFFMQRSQKPITLTALKLFPITLDTNISIAKFSFSLYTLIRNLDFGQNVEI